MFNTSGNRFGMPNDPAMSCAHNIDELSAVPRFSESARFRVGHFAICWIMQEECGMKESISKRVQFHRGNWLTNVRLRKRNQFLSFDNIRIDCLSEPLDGKRRIKAVCTRDE